MRRVLVVSLVMVLWGCGEVAPTDVIAPESPFSLSMMPGGGASGLPYGPVVFDREAGTPVTMSTTVHFDGFEPPFRLVVENDGTYAPISPSAVVRLGGEEIFGTDSFNAGTPAILSAEVNPNGDPVLTLEVELRGTPSSGFRIRIEGSGEVLAGPGGGELDLGGGDVGLDLPAGAVQEEVVLTADPVEAPPVGSTGALEGTVFDLGPEGQTFDEPIELTFSYDQQAIDEVIATKPGVKEEDLALFTLVNGIWLPLQGASVDATTNQVSGLTSHFSQFGINTLTRVCPGEYATVQAAYDATMPGGTIEVCDHQTHSVEGVTLDAPVRIVAAPEALSAPVLQTTTELAAFWVDGYTSGTVLIDGIAFDFDTPTGPAGMRSYAVQAVGTYDQLVVQNTSFNIDPGARGGIYSRLSSEPTAATTLDNLTIVGGALSVVGENARVDLTNSSIDPDGYGIFFYDSTPSPSSGTVQGNTFVDCGSVRCVHAGNSSSVDVISNTFPALTLTGISDPDPNEVIRFRTGAMGLIDGNTFNGCAYWDCVAAESAGTNVTISNNDFTHIAGQSEWDYSDIILVHRSATATIEYNTLHSCGVICYKVLDGANATIRNETVSTPSGHGTIEVVTGAEDDPASANNTITFANNSINGAGETKAAYLRATNATVTGNTFSNLMDGFELDTEVALTGTDNVLTLSGTAIIHIEPGSSVDFQFNDLTGQAIDIGSFGDGSGVLTCNWWGDAAGPQNTAGVPSTMYVPWATAPIANGAGGACDGGAVRVAAADNGSGLPFVATIAEAVTAVPAGGRILLSNGTHTAEGITLDKPLSIEADPGASPMIRTTTELAAFWVDGYASGTVLIDGIAFDFDTPTGPAGMRSYAVQAVGTYDQLVVQNTSFNIDPGARGGIYSRLSSEPTAATTLDNLTIVGGALSIVAENAHVDLLNSTIDPDGYGIFFYDSTPSASSGLVQGNTFVDCGSVRCVHAGNSSSVDVLSNTFPALTLTGISDPDPNEVIRFRTGAMGLIDGNTFNGCAYWDCVAAESAGTNVTISNNDFTHIAGQSEWDYSDIILVHRSATATIEYNTLHSCGVICYKILDGANATIRNETVSTPSGHGTIEVVTGAEDDPASANNTITFANNSINGAGETKAAYLRATNATVTGNTFSNLMDGFELDTEVALTGTDNVLTLSGTAILRIEPGSSVDFQSNDFTGQTVDIGTAGDGTAVLTCNWWGDAAGPQNPSGVPAGLEGMYTPWATAPIAQGAGGACDGS